ncbi:MAG: DUF1330 domain-containing protein [Candidatus Zixiibacteriota bacterium]
MPYVNIVGLHVTDQEGYASYRANMIPILTEYGGSFQFDCEVARDLKEPTRTINRLFAITFPDEATKVKFFSDPRYLEVRKQYFNPAVAARYSLFEFTAPGD